MSTSLTFRKESIQKASAMSASLHHPATGSAAVQGPKHGGNWVPPTLTTTLTTLQ